MGSVPSLKLTFLHLKMDGWNTIPTFPFGARYMFRGELLDLLVSGRVWVFPKIGIPQNGWFLIMENPIKMDDLGEKPTIFGNTLIFTSKWVMMHSEVEEVEVEDRRVMQPTTCPAFLPDPRSEVGKDKNPETGKDHGARNRQDLG